VDRQPDPSPAPSGAPRGLALIVLILVGLAVLFLAFNETSSSQLSAPPPTAALPTSAPTLALAVTVATDPSGFEARTVLPLDFAPRVSGAPGPDAPIFSAESGLTLLYVNTIGRPTIVDLDSGDRREVDISRSRPYDSFLVEGGEVVSEDRDYLAEARATDRAIVVHVHQPGIGADASDVTVPVGAEGPHLCIGDCASLRWTSESLSDGLDIVETLDAAKYPQIAGLFEPTGWAREGRWLLAPDDLGLNFRIPAPAESATIWIIYQPNI